MTAYLYDKFPALLYIDPTDSAEYVSRVKSILGISGCFYTTYDFKFKNNKVAKKGHIFVSPQIVASLGECITIKSYCYKIQITISKIYHCDPGISITTIEENK